MTERYRFDQVEIQIQRAADRSRYARNELNVQATASDIIVFDQREHLRFVCISIVIWAMQYLVDIVDERRAPYASRVLCETRAPSYSGAVKSHSLETARSLLCLDSAAQSIRQCFIF